MVRGVVLRVDVVPSPRVCEGGNVPNFIREEGGFGDVLAMEEVVCQVGGAGGEVHGGEVGDGAVAEGAPCCGLWEERGEGEEDGGDVHVRRV